MIAHPTCRIPLVLLAATLLLSAAAPAKEVPVNEKTIKEAIDRGKEYLLGKQDAAGLFEGEFKKEIGSTALVVCALRKAGLPPEHEAIKKAMPHILKYAASNLATDEKVTYNAGCCLLALDATRPPQADSYGGSLPQDKQIQAAAEKLAGILVKNIGNRGGWHYFNKRDGDLSCTQYGGLGLWAAQRLGLTIPRPIWDGLSQYVMKVHQDEGGGFTYHDAIKNKEKPTHTMTAAGIGTLALALRQATKKEMTREVMVGGDDNYDDGSKSRVTRKTEVVPVVEAKKPQTEVEKAIERGFIGLKALEFESKNAYYWYALERACTLTGTKLLDKEPWYDALAKQILREQNEKGAWSAGREPTCDTAWALLALTRATGQMVHPEKYDDSYDSAASGKSGPKAASKPAAPPAKAAAKVPAPPKPPAKPVDE